MVAAAAAKHEPPASAPPPCEPPLHCTEEPPVALLVRGSGAAAEDACARLLRDEGVAVWDGAVPHAALAAARAALAPVLAACADRFDAAADALDLRGCGFGVVRTPRVNRGKRNVHFDPHAAAAGAPGAAMAALAAAGGFDRVLSAALGAPASLQESGLSVTAPGGQGMEWHADGTAGEATVLLSLTDVPPDRGALGLLPRSHAAYRTAKGDGGGDEEEDDARGQRLARAGGAAWYAYRAGVPALLDARTLHAAADNADAAAGAFRFVLWFIYSVGDGGGYGGGYGGADDGGLADAADELAGAVSELTVGADGSEQ